MIANAKTNVTASRFFLTLLAGSYCLVQQDSVVSALASPLFQFQFGLKIPTTTAQFGKILSNTPKKRDNLLESISFTKNGKDATVEKQAEVLRQVRELETSSPPPSTLLTDPMQAKILDGVWYLQYTSPSVVGDANAFPDAWKPNFAEEGDSKIPVAPQFKGSGAPAVAAAAGSIQAQGVQVDTSNRIVTQTIDVASRRVANDVTTDNGTRIYVAGSFRPSAVVPNRAVVSFDTADITLPLGEGLTLKLGFFFTFLSLIRQSKENGWLETTYVDNEMRIGRGNKGTMFILTRDPKAVQP